MKFAQSLTSFYEIALAVAALLVVGLFVGTLAFAARKRARDLARFGDADQAARLTSHGGSRARPLKGALVLLGALCMLLALARPQHGQGTRLVPATNLDVVIVLDYSKSMYARDIAPNRIARAKAEVADLIHRLPGARFGAVAFAGEPMSFPLTVDGAAIAQFFRGLEPNDMPVGGTATARALERAREIFARDPKAKSHVKVILLVTDGEDLEGNPVAVAEECAQEDTRIDVVEVGGRAPEPIPEVDQNGKVIGLRKDDEGKPMMTELSRAGEEQLATVAEKSGGKIVVAKKGQTGIDEIAKDLHKLMHEELSERVETVFDEFYRVPLALALFLLALDLLIVEAPARARKAWRALRGWEAGR